jgi:hypothetical protein
MYPILTDMRIYKMTAHHKIGGRFGVYNGDAKGTVLSINSQEVAYAFDHALETPYSHDRKWFDSNTFTLEDNAKNE